MSTADELNAALSHATEVARQAIEREVLVAVHLLAAKLRRDYPGARYLKIEPSDQGDWMVADQVLDADRNVIEEFDGFDDYDPTGHLYESHAYAWEGFDADTEGRHGYYTLDLDMIAETPLPASKMVITFDDQVDDDGYVSVLDKLHGLTVTIAKPDEDPVTVRIVGAGHVRRQGAGEVAVLPLGEDGEVTGSVYDIALTDDTVVTYL